MSFKNKNKKNLKLEKIINKLNKKFKKLIEIKDKHLKFVLIFEIKITIHEIFKYEYLINIYTIEYLHFLKISLDGYIKILNL